jgi:anti-anti-sigma factor
VDQSTADFFADTLTELIEDPRCRRIEVHLGDVSFMDSSGIDALVWCRNRAVARGRELVVESPHDNVLRVLMITGVWDMFRS